MGALLAETPGPDSELGIVLAWVYWGCAAVTLSASVHYLVWSWRRWRANQNARRRV